MTAASSPTLFFAEDDTQARLLIDFQLRSGNIAARSFETGDELFAAMTPEVEVVLTDLHMPGMSGLELLRQIKQHFPQTEVILLTSVNEARVAVSALKEGAMEYLTKPFDPAQLLHTVRQAQQLFRLKKENKELKESVGGYTGSPDLVAVSTEMKGILAKVPKIARSDHTVLLTGESGTGKGVMARYIHSQSNRAAAPIITVSCPAIPRDLIESELFGHEKGAFSGAVSKRIGKAELANGGTLFLDELGELPLDLQAKLLNFLQDRFFYRVGGSQPVNVDLRIIAATNRDLREQVRAGNFREDLYYRVNVLPIEVPALRQRKEDLPGLAERFLNRCYGRKEPFASYFTAEAADAVLRYDWPGNVRELENMMERLATFHDSVAPIALQELPAEIRQSEGPARPAAPKQNMSIPFVGRTLRELEVLAIAHTIEMCDGNKAQAARMLGISEKSIYNKLKRAGIGNQ
ncbi:MAG: sigma-54 dependent transcriptional regulator [Verrucomicrobiota bacterium JB022]|nr:sigma-54 dependent transcriptional regulator [Verrucomicrobiota bacterium JB022]